MQFSGEGSRPGLWVGPLPPGSGRALPYQGSPQCLLALCSCHPGLAVWPDSDLKDPSPTPKHRLVLTLEALGAIPSSAASHQLSGPQFSITEVETLG